jgi:chloramphenicol 3-O phosphotransferase
MVAMADHGTIVVLNGPPRSGKSSIVRAMQEQLDGVWMNLGVDTWAGVTPARLRPGIGLRPGGERPEVEAVVRGALQRLAASG